MPTPLDVPPRPAWRYEPINLAGHRFAPATFNEHDRAQIHERRDLSKTHDDKATNDQHDDRPANG